MSKLAFIKFGILDLCDVFSF